jgi:hypothetical protein
MREPHRHGLGAERAQHREAFLERGAHLQVHWRILGLQHDANAQPLDAVAKPRGEIGHRLVADRAVVGVMAGDRIHHQRAVLGRARERTDVIERPGARHGAVAAHAAIGGFKSDHAAGRGGQADRAAGIGAKRAVDEARGD